MVVKYVVLLYLWFCTQKENKVSKVIIWLQGDDHKIIFTKANYEHAWAA